MEILTLPVAPGSATMHSFSAAVISIWRSAHAPVALQGTAARTHNARTDSLECCRRCATYKGAGMKKVDICVIITVNITMSIEPPSTEFQELLAACEELALMFPDGIVYIGGIAIYLHAANYEATRIFAEFTHDADFYISMADMSDLRDIEDVTANRRLNKHQLIKSGFDFDIYTEHHAALIVPYDAVVAHSVKFGNLRVAGLEHLFVLKMEAYRDRRHSAKGRKDARDLFRIAAVAHESAHNFKPDLASPYLGNEHAELLGTVGRSPEAMALASGNAKTAKQLRIYFGHISAPLAS